MIRICAILRLLLFVLAMLAILWLSVIPNPSLPEMGFLSWDKALHALSYAFLALLGGWALLPLVTSPMRAWRYALLTVVGYGALLEGVQAWFAPGRQGEVSDLVANAVGGLAVYGLARLYHFRQSNRSRGGRPRL